MPLSHVTSDPAGEGVNALGKIAVNTTICGAISALAVSALTLYREKQIEPYSVVNGICAGNIKVKFKV